MTTQIVHRTAMFVVIMCLPGCSLLINGSGTELRDLDSRQIVRERFGSPDRITQLDLVDPDTNQIRQFEVENYHVHAKFYTAMPVGAWNPLALFIEPYLMCTEAYEAAKEIADGHHLAFVYDEYGNTIGSQYPRPYLGSMLANSPDTNVLAWDRPSDSAE